jgi:2-alkyl-3-oxoalkanoate reductase
VAGATGAIGRPLVSALLSAGYEVVGMTRSPGRAEELSAQGTRGVVCDVYDSDRLRTVLQEARPDVVINELTDLPQVMDRSRLAEFYANNDRMRTTGGDNLLDAALGAGVCRYLVESIAFLYEPAGQEVKTEESPLCVTVSEPTGAAVRATAHAEQAVLGPPELRGTVLRYGYFYGPNTYFRTIDRAARQVPRNGFYCFIHTYDAASATVAAIEAPSGVYNVVDDTWQTGRRSSVSNQKLREAVGWAPSYPGLAPDWTSEHGAHRE